MQYTFRSFSTKDTIKYGHFLAKCCVNRNNIILLLHGELGAGKTTFVHGLSQGLGVVEDISSPSFNLLNIYHTAEYNVYHIDAYRDLHISWESLMLDDIICEPFCCIIEWPEHFYDLPGGYPILSMDIKILSDSRLFTLSTNNNQLASEIRQNFLALK